MTRKVGWTTNYRNGPADRISPRQSLSGMLRPRRAKGQRAGGTLRATRPRKRR
jgi:hypothetical protein